MCVPYTCGLVWLYSKTKGITLQRKCLQFTYDHDLSQRLIQSAASRQRRVKRKLRELAELVNHLFPMSRGAERDRKTSKWRLFCGRTSNSGGSSRIRTPSLSALCTRQRFLAHGNPRRGNLGRSMASGNQRCGIRCAWLPPACTDLSPVPIGFSILLLRG